MQEFATCNACHMSKGESLRVISHLSRSKATSGGKIDSPYTHIVVITYMRVGLVCCRVNKSSTRHSRIRAIRSAVSRWGAR